MEVSVGGCTPVPDKLIVVGELAALLVTTTPPDAAPDPEGAKLTFTLVLCPGLKMIPDRPVALKPEPETLTLEIANLVHLHHQKVGTRAVVVGAELVSWSAVLTLREAACKTALMTSEYAKPEAYAAFTAAGRSILRVPVSARTRVTRIIGRGRVQAIEIEQMDTGRRRIYPCDTVVFTGDWIPDHELARLTGLDLDPATLGPLVDTAMRTSRPGVFAAVNLVHPVDTADVAALDGKHVADQVSAWLDGGDAVDGTAVKGVRILADPPFRWVAPQILRPGDPAPPRGRLLLWTDELVNLPRVTVRQDGRLLASKTLAWPAAPGRMFRVPSHLLKGVSPTEGPIHIGLA